VTITKTCEGKESLSGLPGEVAFHFAPPLLKKRTIAGANHVSFQFEAAVVPSSVTQKPTLVVISWRQGNCR